MDWQDERELAIQILKLEAGSNKKEVEVLSKMEPGQQMPNLWMKWNRLRRGIEPTWRNGRMWPPRRKQIQKPNVRSLKYLRIIVILDN